MLLEPIVPEDRSHHVDDDSKLVAKRFLEYKQIMGQSKSIAKSATLCAYILPGISNEFKAKALSNLQISADYVFDLDRDKDRTSLINRIRALGEDPNRGQLTLPQ